MVDILTSVFTAGAVGAAIAAAWYARGSAVAAKKTLLLTEQQDRRRAPNLELYYKDGYIQRGEDGSIYAFQIRITNKSDVNNTVKEMRFTMSFRNPGAPPATLVLRHVTTEVFSSSGTIQPIIIPCLVEAHQAIEGWAVFNVHNNLLDSPSVPIYNLEVVDTYDSVVAHEPIILREQSDEH